MRCPWLAVTLLVACGRSSSAIEMPQPDPAIDDATPLVTIAAGGATDRELAPAEVAAESAALWARYQREVETDPERIAQHQARAVRWGEVTMRYTAEIIGARPATGYPLYIALHGGGGGPAAMNDAQWADMARYYRDSVEVGVYVAPRGVSDTWDLHFQAASYPLYERLIEDAIVFDGVDPDQVYLLGFSAGGDGVYQIAPRLAPRWAAASMSAGHPNGVGLDNLRAVPFAISVGELDDAYDRNRVDAAYCGRHAELRARHADGYRGACFVHVGRGHNFLDNHPRGVPQAVLADVPAWLARGDRSSRHDDTNAIHWLRQHRRSPLPDHVIWDLRTRPPASGAALHGFYWLAIPAAATLDATIAAHVDRAANAVIITGAPAPLRVRLSPTMLDLSRPVAVRVDDRELTVTPRLRRSTLAATLLEHGDPRLAFAVDLTLDRGDGGEWQVAP